MKKRLFFDMDNVLVDFQSGLDKIDEEIKNRYRAYSGMFVSRRYDSTLDDIQQALKKDNDVVQFQSSQDIHQTL